MAPGDRDGWAKAYLSGLKGGNLFQALTRWARPPAVRYQDPKPQTAVVKTDGPMLYIGQQIVKRMEKMGYPSRIAEHFRSPERQAQLLRGGTTKAGPWRSPHQFGEAVDVVHKTLYWRAPPEYWDALAVCVRVIAADLRVGLTHGHFWTFVDSAHVELTDWRTVRDSQRVPHVPTWQENNARFKAVLPGVPFSEAEPFAVYAQRVAEEMGPSKRA